MHKVVLNGITWGHSRGYTPLVAASQRYHEMHSHVQINWTKRTLQEFADFPLEKLAPNYDLLIIDHPWVGCAAATNTVLDLNKYLSNEYILNQEENSVGQSFQSYIYNGGLWALPIDAATPVASCRLDLLEKNKIAVPQTWESLLELAQLGKVALPAIPIDLLMNFYSFCIVLDISFFEQENFIGQAAGEMVLQKMNELYSQIDKTMFDYNPIKVAEAMSNTDDYWYCPFAYCYSNYSRNGYASNILTYMDVVKLGDKKMSTTIGGTGLAISASCSQIDVAVDFAKWICSSEIQSTLYVQNGGQPGHGSAWQDGLANEITNNFFNTCLPVMENGFMRPRYNGYLHFQDLAGQPIQDFLLGKTTADVAINEMNIFYKQSVQKK